MKNMHKLILSAVTVVFLGVSVAPASAAVPSYASKYSWSGYKTNSTVYSSGYTRTSNANYYNNAAYGYKPAQTTTTVSKPATTTTTTTAKPVSTASITAEEQQMVSLVNQERTSRGLAALSVDSKLVKVARMKSQDMIDKNYFGHQSPTYGSPFDLMKAQGVTYRYAGENLAGADTVQRAHTNLMNSAGHRANILNANFTKVGIGVVHGGPYGLMISQEFTG